MSMNAAQVREWFAENHPGEPVRSHWEGGPAEVHYMALFDYGQRVRVIGKDGSEIGRGTYVHAWYGVTEVLEVESDYTAGLRYSCHPELGERLEPIE